MLESLKLFIGFTRRYFQPFLKAFLFKFFGNSKLSEGYMLNIEHFNMMLISKVATFVVNRGVTLNL